MRLVDADYGQKQLTIAEVECGKNFETDCNHVRDFLNAMPTIDAVPVVRCAKCEHWVENDDGQYVCALFDIANSYGEPVITKPDDFCSYGKRKGCAD